MANVASGHPATDDRVAPLGVARALADRLSRDGIRYCAWKGLEGLADTLSGSGDVDLLFARSDADRARVAFIETGFRLVRAAPWREHAGEETWLGLDPDAGRIVHVHFHVALTIGAKRLQEYRCRWEERLLACSAPDPGTGMPVVSAEMELVLTALRASLAPRPVGALVRLRLLHRAPPKASRRFDAVRERADVPAALALCEELLGPRPRRALEELAAAGMTAEGLLRLRAAARHALRRDRCYQPIESGVVAWGRFALSALTVALVRSHAPVPSRRTCPSGGAVIAFVGVDGSGKSTVAREVTRELARHIDVLPVYFGTGGGPVSLPRLLLKPLRNLLVARWKRRVGSTDEATGGAALAASLGGSGLSLPQLARLGWALLVAWEKWVRLHRAWAAAARGMLVVADRYPQAEVVGGMDGPIAAEMTDHPWPLVRALARWSCAAYDEARRRPPDLVVRLSIAPAAAHARKPEHGVEWAAARTAALDAVTFGGAPSVTINAEQPLSDVIVAAKRQAWGCQ